MKCPSCKAEWSSPANLTIEVANCPFCGTALHIERKEEYKSIEDVLVEIVQQ